MGVMIQPIRRVERRLLFLESQVKPPDIIMYFSYSLMYTAEAGAFFRKGQLNQEYPGGRV